MYVCISLQNHWYTLVPYGIFPPARVFHFLCFKQNILNKQTKKVIGFAPWMQVLLKDSYDLLTSFEICCCSITKSCLTLWDPMDRRVPVFPINHYLLVFAQIHIHWVCDAIQSSHPLSPPSPPAQYLSQHQSLFQWVNPLHRVTKVSELQLQHQSFQRIFRADFL